MKKTSYLAVILLFAIAGCTEKFKKQPKSAMEYKIISGNGDKQIKYGDAVKFTVTTYYKDSIMSTPMDTIAQVLDVDSTKLPPDYLFIFKSAKKGDSIVTRILVDSALKLGPLPPFAKKGQYIGFRIKVLDVTSDPTLASAMRQASMQSLGRADSMARIAQKAKDDKILSDRISSDKANAVKTAKGVYVVIQTPGEGEAIDSGKAVTVDYKGMTLAGKVFDQSYDASGNSLHPFTFPIGQHAAIEGWEEGIKLFKKGGKGRIYIPSGLAYGQRGAGADIKANECLIFDISVVDVMTMAQYQKQMADKQKAQTQAQQQSQGQQGQQGQQQTPPPTH